MVASVGDFDRDVGQLCFIQEMARQLTTGPRQIGTVGAVICQHALDPPLWSEDERDDQDQSESNKDRHDTLRLSAAWASRPRR
jgi:hypothetical protein